MAVYKKRTLQKKYDFRVDMSDENTGDLSDLKQTKEGRKIGISVDKNFDGKKKSADFEHTSEIKDSSLPLQKYDTASRLSEIDDPNVKNKRPTIGPVKASANIRVTSRFDYQPDICKDWYETGFCTFGDACKFMHTREDYKEGWKIEKEWEEEQKRKNEALSRRLKSGLYGEDAVDDDMYEGKKIKRERDDGEDNANDDDTYDNTDDSEYSNVPFACLSCKNRFVNPVVTLCKHYFCETCAFGQYAKSPKCFVCKQSTNGIFNTAHVLLKKEVIERNERIWRRRDRMKKQNEDKEKEKEKGGEKGKGKGNEEREGREKDKREKEKENENEKGQGKKRARLVDVDDIDADEKFNAKTNSKEEKQEKAKENTPSEGGWVNV